ncbi:[FeFe]-hydrogenase maturation protein HydE [Candidatus Syntrophocurvum alkaliphilum]|uniref:[FeFe]-hydrogenase maturation protein HydE n=1 Tax=Candidatus Syntrophocurvum alkaliphilum TaxID=2293317 RepID=A0A6I6DDM0_9FIRM|nr:[FeFe] hydrogenase H-cluster radical SAM maturase HydE [Candidatus Syntrophocurvum alkaliphilum]QGT99366.1 [FeFe]-hydrogenase maturation protein HydE [Candidatus Syntrophocurvum alkaliphilum]
MSSKIKTLKQITNKLYYQNNLDSKELLYLLNNINTEIKQDIIEKSNKTKINIYGNKIFMRGLIEFTNYCKKSCEYCGIRAQNKNIDRYRLSLDQILSCCEEGNKLGFKTFVLQGGEDSYYTDDKIVEIIQTIKKNYSDSAITLSIGEKSYDSYKNFFDAGADRYLLRHETASKELYDKFHKNSSFESRIKCLWNLKKIGFQVGAGFMIGLPGQSNEDLVKDVMFIKELQPHMVGIGPFIPHKDTSLRNNNSGTIDKTIIMLAIIRLFLPKVLLPATTALGSIDPLGREKGLQAGANVVMPNLSPTVVRDKYALYDGKICTGDEAAKCRTCIEDKINKAGFTIDMSRGDHISWKGR